MAGTAQLRLALGQRLVITVASLEAGDAHVGMALEQAHELATGDTGSAGSVTAGVPVDRRGAALAAHGALRALV